MRPIAMILLVACGGSDPAIQYDCIVLTKMITMERTACAIDASGTQASPSDGCPYTMGAFCQPSGGELDCPDGWDMQCEGGPNETPRNCTVHGDGCTSASGETATFGYRQSYGSQYGIAVLVDPMNNLCEFRPCE